MKIGFDDERVSISGGREIIFVKWTEIDSIVAYKKDCLYYDQLRLNFATCENVITVVEEDEGFAELLTILPRYLPGFPSQESWWDTVIQPPFQSNSTILYSRRKS